MVLFVAATPYEFAGFPATVRQSSDQVRWLARATVGKSCALLVANGLGRHAASAGTRAVLATSEVSAVVSTGFAGALDPLLRVGQAFLARTILANGTSYRASLPAAYPADLPVGTLLTVDRVVRTARAKSRLAKRGCFAVDMEAAAVAAVARERGVPFYCLRAVSDGFDQDLPFDFREAERPGGHLDPGRLLLQAATQPRFWSPAMRLWRGARLAARSLATAACSCRFGAA